MKKATIVRVANLYYIEVDGHEYSPLTKKEIEEGKDLPDEVAEWARMMLSKDNEDKWRPWPRETP